AFRRFNSRCSWITCVNTDGVSTDIDSSCWYVFCSLRRGSLDHRLDRRSADDPVTALPLGLVQGGVRRRDQVVHARAGAAGGDAEAGGDVDGPAARGPDGPRRDEPPGALRELDPARDPGSDEDQRELLASP